MKKLNFLAGSTALATIAWASIAHGQSAPQNQPTQLGTIRVQDTALRDAGATEGSGSYAGGPLTLGKTPTSFRELPQSASILTRERIEDQNFTDIGDALRYTTGVQTFSVGGDYTSFSAQARGATVDYQVNGLNQLVDDRGAQFDLAYYDRIEVLRGPAGLFKGAGSAGGTVNLVRKFATAAPHYRGALTGGTWGTVRAEADVTGPLNASGNVRGRLVLAAEERGTHLRNTEYSKYFGYGTLEFDLDEDTTVAVGGVVQQAEMPYFFGLPAFANGTQPDVPRSTSFTTDWAYGDLSNTSVFAELEHRLGNGGYIKAVLQRSQSHRFAKSFFSGGGLQASGQMNVSVNAEDIPTTNLVGDVYLSTPFSLFGQQHNVLIGADYADTSQVTWRAGSGALPQINLFTFDPSTIPEPTFNVLFSDLQAKTRNYGTYGQLRLKPIEEVTLIAGGRFSWRELNDHNRINNTRTAGPDVSAQFTPYLAAIYDVTENISLYASDSQIFQAQSATTVAGTLLPPIIGRQYEVGVKGDFFDGALNASMAAFQTTRSNEALPDALNPGFSLPGGKRRVEGVEAEVTGRLLPGWDISAGYAFNEAKILVAAAGAVITSFPSKHAFNLWTNYEFSEGLVSGLEVGGGLRMHSSFFTRSGAVRFGVDGYTVAALRVGYTVSDNIKAAVNVENLFDETYYAKAGNATANNYFGAPRSIMFTIRAAY